MWIFFKHKPTDREAKPRRSSKASFVVTLVDLLSTFFNVEPVNEMMHYECIVSDLSTYSITSIDSSSTPPPLLTRIESLNGDEFEYSFTAKF